MPLRKKERATEKRTFFAASLTKKLLDPYPCPDPQPELSMGELASCTEAINNYSGAAINKF